VNSENHSFGDSRPFTELARKFLEKTQELIRQGINPGGIYHAIWCRDASYILMDWFLSGNIEGTMQQIHQIWSHQITSPSIEKIVYGRGSIDMKFLSEVYNDKKEEFNGALPTSIYQAGFSEVYGENPDIDSTALMISATAWILARCANKEKSLPNSITKSPDSSDYLSGLLLKVGITDPAKLTDYVVPRMFSAVEYLSRRDIDNDDLLEQGHNEDWMDTILRAGKIVYSQACWILALTNFGLLLEAIGRDKESRKIIEQAERVIKAVNDILWSEEDNCYLDIQDEHHVGGPYRTLMQDVSLFLIAAHGYFFRNDIQQEDNINSTNRKQIKNGLSEQIHVRSEKTLDTFKKRLWKDGWPLVTEAELKITGPWILKPHQYHNQTIWPWCTALEILARSKFNQIADCTSLLSEMSTGEPYMISFYEWINPVDKHPDGAFPFRTGISSVRLAISEIVHPQTVDIW
jgi:glycogen debranching enzyme